MQRRAGSWFSTPLFFSASAFKFIRQVILSWCLFSVLFIRPASAQPRHLLVDSDLNRASESAQLALARLCEGEQAFYFSLQATAGGNLPIAFVPFEKGEEQARWMQMHSREDVSVSDWWPHRNFFGWMTDGLPSKISRLVRQAARGRRPIAIVALDLSVENPSDYVESILRQSGVSGSPISRGRFIELLAARKFPLPYATAIGNVKIVAHHMSLLYSLEVEPIWPFLGSQRAADRQHAFLRRLAPQDAVERFPLEHLAETDKAFLLWDNAIERRELLGYLTQDTVSSRLRFHFPNQDEVRVENYLERLRAALGQDWTPLLRQSETASLLLAEPPVMEGGGVSLSDPRRAERLYWADPPARYEPEADRSDPCPDQMQARAQQGPMGDDRSSETPTL